MAATAGATIAGVPALVRFRGSPEAAAERGTVLYYHGFGGDKGRCEPYLTALTETGFLGGSLDAAGTGTGGRPASAGSSTRGAGARASGRPGPTSSSPSTAPPPK